MRIRIAFISLLLAAASYSFGQASQGMPHQYNPATDVTVTGTVEEVLHPKAPNGMVGTHVNLKTASGVLDVHLGPETFISKQGFTIAWRRSCALFIDQQSNQQNAMSCATSVFLGSSRGLVSY